MARGIGRIYKRATTWWIQWSDHGTRRRESSRSTLRSDAVSLLKRRLAEADKTRPSDAKKVTLQDLLNLVLADYRTKERRSSDRVTASWAHLSEHLGPEARAVGISYATLTAYLEARLGERARPGKPATTSLATVKLEITFLKRGFTLARKASMLSADQGPQDYPVIPLNNSRTGFFEADQIAAVLEHLPEPVAHLIEFLSWTGWRKSEAMGLTWDSVDMALHVARIEKTKTDEARTLPFGKLPALVALMEKRHATKNGPHVFHRRGKPIKAFAISWATAVKAAGCPSRIPHDLRRTVIRNLVRAGVPATVAMKITGHKTRSVFDRYDITDEADMADGLGKLVKE